MLSNKQIVDNLNLTGNFLEASIFSDLVSSKHFLVTAEWPYSTPTFHGTADIIALNHQASWESEPLVFFIIECKKAKVDQKVWVFDRSRTKRDLNHPFIKVSETGHPIYEDRTGYLLPDLGVHQVEAAPIFNKGYELRENDGNLNRNESERIYSSLTQANKALVGLVNSNYKNVFNVSPLVFEGKKIFIVPIVITNATLKIIEYTPDKINKKTGEIKTSDMKSEDRDWIIFDYPLPNDLQIRGAYGEGDIQPIKRPTYIVNAENAVDFMQSVCNQAEY